MTKDLQSGGTTDPLSFFLIKPALSQVDSSNKGEYGKNRSKKKVDFGMFFP